MLRLFTIIFSLFSIGFFYGCKRSEDPKGRLLSKIEQFRSYNAALDQCKKLPVDSLLQCARSAINLDTIDGIEDDIWHEYGRAKALFHNNQGAEAINVINEVLPKTERHALLFERAALLQLRSDLFAVSFKMQLAAEDGYRAADIYHQLDLIRKASSCYRKIADLQYNAANYSIAVKNGLYTVKLLKGITSKNHEDSVQIMHAYNTLGLGYYKLNHLDSAEKYYDLSYDMATLLKDEFWEGLVGGNKGDIYLAKGMIDKAIENYQYDIRTSLKYNDPASAALSLMVIGEIYVSNNQLDIARNYYDSAYVLLMKSGRPISLSKYYSLMSQWFELKNDYANAFSYYKKHIEFRDSVQSIQINSQLQQIQNQNQFEKQLSDINLLKAENELRRKELWISRISIFAFLLVSSSLLGLLYTVRRNNRKLNQLNRKLETKVSARTAKLRKINRELDTYLYRASHDVRRPILTILGLIQVADVTNDNERHTIRDTIKKTAYEMDKMLKKLQMAYEVEKENISHKTTIEINNYVINKISELNKEYPCVTFDVIEKYKVAIKSNANLIDIILTNILENACVFSEGENAHASVVIALNNGFVDIIVKDNGIGIDPNFIGKIFNSYTRFNNRSTGSGLGLYLARKAAKKLGGNIKVNSKLNEGSEFMVSLPIR